jgi:hypothetical protein
VNREREVWWRLVHPNILPLYGYCENFGTFGAMISPVSIPAFCSLSASISFYLWSASLMVNIVSDLLGTSFQVVQE